MLTLYLSYLFGCLWSLQCQILFDYLEDVWAILLGQVWAILRVLWLFGFRKLFVRCLVLVLLLLYDRTWRLSIVDNFDCAIELVVTIWGHVELDGWQRTRRIVTTFLGTLSDVGQRCVRVIFFDELVLLRWVEGYNRSLLLLQQWVSFSPRPALDTLLPSIKHSLLAVGDIGQHPALITSLCYLSCINWKEQPSLESG